MKGKHTVSVETRRVKYEITLNRNITIIQGNSATGKTTLIGYIDDYYNEGKKSGVKLKCDKTCIVLKGKNWQLDLEQITDSIVFIDEGSKFIKSNDFADAIKHTDNYYVIITREDLSSLPYSVHEIYGLRSNGSTESGTQLYNETYRIFGKYITDKGVTPDVVITEDDKSGFQFFSEVCNRRNIKCETSKGKYNIVKMIDNRYAGSTVLIIADGAAFGPHMREVMEYVDMYPNYIIYLPESFEWLLLKSNILRDENIIEILSSPSDYIDSTQYFSWERYFTHLIEEVSLSSTIVTNYTKSKLNKIFLSEANINKVLDVILYINLR